MLRIFTYLSLIFSITMIAYFVYIFVRQKKWGKPLLRVKVKHNFIEKYIWYLVLLISAPSFFYDLFIGNSLYNSSRNLLLFIISVFFIYRSYAGLCLYRIGISHIDRFIKWEKISKYDIVDNILKFKLVNKNKTIVYNIDKESKKELMKILEKKLMKN